jgi:Predicted transcriptional regulators containing the CopG/Arc/MetJ DNA-binding domain and a metal-binding domain
MTEEGTKVTIRMGPEEIQMMEDFMADRGIGNRSDFIRDAIRGYIEVQANPSCEPAAEGGIFVHLGEVQMGTLEMLRQDGICYDIEEFARKCILDRIVSQESEKDSIDRALKAAQMASRMK